MTANKDLNKSIWLFVCLSVLFFSRAVYLITETNGRVIWIHYLVECIVFSVSYTLCFSLVSKLIQALFLLVGTAGLVSLYGVNSLDKTSAFLPLLYFPVFIFLIYISFNEKQKISNAFRARWIGFMWIYLVSVPVIAFFVITEKLKTGRFSAYGTVLFLLVCGLYSLILCYSRKSDKKATKRRVKGERKINKQPYSVVNKSMFGFVFAVISMIESCICLQLMEDDYLTHIIPLLWIIDLIVLYSQQQPAVFAFFKEVNKRIDILIR